MSFENNSPEPSTPTPEKPAQELVQVSRVHQVKPRNKGWLRFIVTILIAALIGGAAGGAAGYTVAGQKAAPSGGEQNVAAEPPKVIREDSHGNLSVTDIAAKVVPGVVGVTNYGRAADMFGNSEVAKRAAGSGVIIRNDGTIVTNYHVVEGAVKIGVTLSDMKTYDAKVVGYDQSSDLAVLKIDAKNLTAVPIGDSGKLRVGDLAVAVGNPLSEQFSQSVTDGIISGINRKLRMDSQGVNLIQTNCAINSGNSGGALVNGRGELVGINSAKIKATGVEGIGFAIPINEAMKIVEELEKNGHIEHPYIGVSGYTITPELAEQAGLDPKTKGLLVVQMVQDGPAEQAGIKQRDIITKVNDQPVESFEDFAKVLKEKKPGDKLKLVVNRDGKEVEVEVTLGQRGSAGA